MVIHSHCAGKVSGIGKRTYMVLLLQSSALEGILLEVRILCASTTLKTKDFKSATCAVCFSPKSALYSGLLACEVFKRCVSFQFMCLSYKRFSTQVCKFYEKLTTTYKGLRFKLKPTRFQVK